MDICNISHRSTGPKSILGDGRWERPLSGTTIPNLNLEPYFPKYLNVSGERRSNNTTVEECNSFLNPFRLVRSRHYIRTSEFFGHSKKSFHTFIMIINPDQNSNMPKLVTRKPSIKSARIPFLWPAIRIDNNTSNVPQQGLYYRCVKVKGIGDATSDH